MKKQVAVLVGAGSIGQAIIRRVSAGKQVIPPAQNLDILDFELSADDMAQIQTLDTGKSLVFDQHDGEVTKMFMGWRWCRWQFTAASASTY